MSKVHIFSLKYQCLPVFEINLRFYNYTLDMPGLFLTAFCFLLLSVYYSSKQISVKRDVNSENVSKLGVSLNSICST